MKQISCEFADQDLAEQAVHSLRQHGYAIKEESLEAKEYGLIDDVISLNTLK